DHPTVMPPRFFSRISRPLRTTLFPYTTLFRSVHRGHQRASHRRAAKLGAQPEPPDRSGQEGVLPVFFELLAARRNAALDPRQHRSEEHTSELQSRGHLVCRLLLEKKKKKKNNI